MVASATRSRLRHSLNDIDFPASKQDLVDAAGSNGDDETVRALRSMPPETYANLDQVCASVTIVDDSGGISETDKAAARGTHTKPGRAEAAKDIASESPIVEELGENRGS